MNEETLIGKQIHAALNGMSDVRVFRNSCGLGFVGEMVNQDPPLLTLRNAMPVKFGLHAGSSDFIGWKSLTVTPDMVGKKVAVFVGVEVKTAKGRESKDQKNWREQVTRAGGIGMVVRSTDEALDAIKRR